MDLDASSVESSEDWENSVNSSELDVQYQSDEERADNEVKIDVAYVLISTIVVVLLLNNRTIRECDMLWRDVILIKTLLLYLYLLC